MQDEVRDTADQDGQITWQKSELARIPVGGSPSLAEIMSRSLAHIQTSKMLGTLHRIGDYDLCGPDYQLVCALGEELRYAPEMVLTQLMDNSPNQEIYSNGKLVMQVHSFEAYLLDKIQSESPSTIVNGHFKSLLVIRHKLPIAALPWIAGLSINKVTLHDGYYTGDKEFDIDFRSLPDLDEFSCRSFHLNNLELAHVPQTRILKFIDSNLGILDLSKVPNLVELSCRGNNLQFLDLSPVPNLEILDCGANQLKTLDLSSVPKLRELRCDNNDIDEIDIRNLTSFKPDACWGIDDLLRGKEVRVIKRRDQ